MLGFEDKNKNYYINLVHQDLNEFFNFITLHQEIESYPKVAPHLDLIWLPNIQVFIVRSKKNSPIGHNFFLAGKAGNNRKLFK